MRCILYPGVVIASAVTASAAYAQVIEGEVSVHTSYIDIGSFNDRFSSDPVVQLTLTADLGGGFYLEPYVYTGFNRPLRDVSSEFGIEAGWEGEIAPTVTANLAAGRWSNYRGEGLRAGDWFGRIGITYQNISVSMSVLQGESDTVLLNAEYELRLSQLATIKPGVAYITAEGTFNPGVELSYRIIGDVSLNLRVAAPQTADGRRVYGSGGLVWTFH